MNFVREWNLDARLKFDLELASEINVDDLVAVIPNVEFFVRPNVKAVAIVSVFADDAPNGEVIDVHLIPVMIFDGINQSFVGFFRQFNGAILGLLGFFVKCYVDSAEIELGSLQGLS